MRRHQLEKWSFLDAELLQGSPGPSATHTAEKMSGASFFN
jgi:hypothetical protein